MLPGTVTLIGSGETSSTGGQVFEAVARALPAPLKISILETPAGFETNAQRVAGRVAEFLKTRLQNQRPQIELIAARKKGTSLSPDSADVVRPLYDSQLIFFGPGSPTYTVRQLENSLAWDVLQARHRLGASLVLASAATIALGQLALPVYEIFKVGEDPHWKNGLDFFRPYGLSLVIIPHWNNREGGEEVDTSHCFIGSERFNALMAGLPPGATLLGIDEHTAVTISFDTQIPCQVRGQGEIHIIRGAAPHRTALEKHYQAGSTFPISELGSYRALRSPEIGLPAAVWEQAVSAERAMEQRRISPEHSAPPVPREVQILVDERQAARLKRDWALADQLRGRIANLGWNVKDTPAGPELSQGD